MKEIYKNKKVITMGGVFENYVQMTSAVRNFAEGCQNEDIFLCYGVCVFNEDDTADAMKHELPCWFGVKNKSIEYDLFLTLQDQIDLYNKIGSEQYYNTKQVEEMIHRALATAVEHNKIEEKELDKKEPEYLLDTVALQSRTIGNLKSIIKNTTDML